MKTIERPPDKLRKIALQRRAKASGKGDLVHGSGRLTVGSGRSTSHIRSNRVSRTASLRRTGGVAWRRHTPGVSRWRWQRNCLVLSSRRTDIRRTRMWLSKKWRGFAITGIELVTSANGSGHRRRRRFQKFVADAKQNCPCRKRWLQSKSASGHPRTNHPLASSTIMCDSRQGRPQDERMSKLEGKMRFLKLKNERKRMTDEN